MNSSLKLTLIILSSVSLLLVAHAASAFTGAVNRIYTFQATATDPEGDSIYYNFNWGDGSPETRVPSSGTVASGTQMSGAHQWSPAGVYSVYVVACDASLCSLQSDPQTADIQLPSKPGPLTLSSGINPSPNGTFTLDWSANPSDPHSLISVPVTISQYDIWRQVNGGLFYNIGYVTSNSYATSSAADGDYNYNIIARDDTVPANFSPASDSYAITVDSSIGGTPPVADFDSCTLSADTVQFEDLSTDDGALTWSWDFGDGTPLSSQQHPSHAFAVSTTPFDDAFTEESSNTELTLHTPAPTGSGWTKLYQVGSGTITLGVNASADNLQDNGACTINQGVLYQTNDLITSADYEVSVRQVNGDGGDDYNLIAARIQDQNNYYAFKWNETSGALYKRIGGTWTALGAATAAIVDGSIVTLRGEGNTISVRDDGVEIRSVTDASITAAGRAGVGMGALQTSTDDCDTQALDDFKVNVTASTSVRLTVTDIGGQQDTILKTGDPLTAPACSSSFLLNNAVATKCNEIGLTWTHAMAANNYTLSRRTCANPPTCNTWSSWVVPAGQSNLTTLLTYDAVAQETTYQYYLAANLPSLTTLSASTASPACTGSWSGLGPVQICPLTATTGSCVPSITSLPPTSPCGAITLSWSSITGTVSYRVWRNIGSDNSAAAETAGPIATVPNTQTSYTDTDIVPDVDYYYYVSNELNPPSLSTGVLSKSSCFRGSRWQER